MLGMPNQTEVRFLSQLGLSMVTVVFQDSVPYYFARQLVNERLQQVGGTLPFVTDLDELSWPKLARV